MTKLYSRRRTSNSGNDRRLKFHRSCRQICRTLCRRFVCGRNGWHIVFCVSLRPLQRSIWSVRRPTHKSTRLNTLVAGDYQSNLLGWSSRCLSRSPRRGLNRDTLLVRSKQNHKAVSQSQGMGEVYCTLKIVCTPTDSEWRGCS
jgi:hypothetical protein